MSEDEEGLLDYFHRKYGRRNSGVFGGTASFGARHSHADADLHAIGRKFEDFMRWLGHMIKWVLS